jgi:hypothetical protein
MPEETGNKFVEPGEWGLVGVDDRPPSPPAEDTGPKLDNDLPPAIPTQGEIRLAAYWLWAERVGKGLPGDEEADWLRAEKHLWENYYECLQKYSSVS